MDIVFSKLLMRSSEVCSRMLYKILINRIQTQAFVNMLSSLLQITVAIIYSANTFFYIIAHNPVDNMIMIQDIRLIELSENIVYKWKP